jgi:hypothetical protein
MALSDAYATASEYRAAFDMTSDSQDSEILSDLKAVSRYIDGKMGRFFNKDSEDKTRVYYCPADSTKLWIDDLSAAPTSITIDQDTDGTCETTLSSSDYELYPVNAPLDPEQRPYMCICLTSWGDEPYFSQGERVEVVGKFGWPAVPEAVKRATIHLTAILRLETSRATRRIPELGDAIEASPEAQGIIRQLLDKYKRRWLV